MMILPTLLLLVAPCMAAAAPAEEGLVAHYRFDEGKGSALHDSSGNGNDGAIRGAAWVPSGEGFALRFDGVDDSVDCGAGPSLNLTKTVSVEAWVCPEAPPGAGEAGIVGKSYESYGLTYYTDGQCWWYISGGGNNCRAPLTTGTWHHVVGTFDGERLNLYVDGALAGSTRSKEAAIGEAKSLLMGTSTGDPQFTRGAHFKGMLDEVRIYSRALSASEVARHYRTTRLTNQMELRTSLYVFSGKLAVELDLRGLGELPADAVAVVEFRMPGKAEAIQTQRLSPLPAQAAAETTFKLGEVAPGDCELRATAMTADGKKNGRTSILPLRWPERPQWKDARGARVLSNLVTELANIPFTRGGKESVPFVAPRDGWVFISSTAQADAANPVTLAVDGAPVHTHVAADTLEAMRFLPKGLHTVQFEAKGTSALGRLILRAVPELAYSKFGADPHVTEYGKYDWEFLKKHVLPNLNVMVGTGAADQKPFIEEWKRQGKRWMVECGVPGLAGDAKVTADEAEEYWSEHAGMTDPLIDGVLADEFFGSDDAKYAAWTEAIRRIRANPKLKGKSFYPYCGPMYGAKASRELIQATMDAGWKFAFERYLPEQRGEAAARAYLDTALHQPIAAWREAMPGAERHMIVVVGYFSQPPESLDVNPSINYKVYLDMQLNLLANDPACFGLGGVMTYLSSYSDEETVRWAGKLFRHYCIEGKSELLSTDPLILPHIQNPDFEDGMNGWTVAPAEEGSIGARKADGFSWLQGRYPPTSQGDTVLWMRRSARRPNTVSQKVKALRPGRLYSCRMYSGDFRDLSAKQKHALSVRLGNVDVVREKSFQHVFPNCYSHHHGPFDAEHKAWMNYHWIVFRAKGDGATLEISDWPSDKEPGGPVGQELMMNFVEIQPYDEE